MDGLDDLPGLQAFERVAARGSLTAAATELGISLTAISKRLAAFEHRLGVQLIHRSTRSLSMTDEGRLLQTYAARVMDELQQAKDALTHQRDGVGGVLRMTAPNSFGRRHLVPLITEFQASYPQVRVHLHLSDDVLDLVASGMDLAIRYGELADSRLVARVLAKNRRILCASPAYLKHRGLPQRLSDLADHDCILIGTASAAEWRFDSQGRQRALRIEGHIVSSDGEAVHALALHGAGIVLKSMIDVTEDIERGALIQVLPQYAISDAPLNVVYARGHHLAPRVRTFIDFLFEKFPATPAATLPKRV